MENLKGIAPATRLLTEYCDLHSSQLIPAASAIRTSTSTHPRSHMMLPPNLINLIGVIMRALRPNKCLEIGAFTGQLTAILAEALAENATLRAFEDDPETYERLAKNLSEQDVSRGVGIAQEEGFTWLSKTREIFDLIVLDARKEAYAENYGLLINHLSVGGVLIVDNVLCRGAILNPQRDFEVSMAGFNSFLANDERMLVSMLPIRDGLTVAYRIE